MSFQLKVKSRTGRDLNTLSLPENATLKDIKEAFHKKCPYNHWINQCQSTFSLTTIIWSWLFIHAICILHKANRYAIFHSSYRKHIAPYRWHSLLILSISVESIPSSLAILIHKQCMCNFSFCYRPTDASFVWCDSINQSIQLSNNQSTDQTITSLLTVCLLNSCLITQLQNIIHLVNISPRRSIQKNVLFSLQIPHYLNSTWQMAQLSISRIWVHKSAGAQCSWSSTLAQSWSTQCSIGYPACFIHKASSMQQNQLIAATLKLLHIGWWCCITSNVNLKLFSFIASLLIPCQSKISSKTPFIIGLLAVQWSLISCIILCSLRRNHTHLSPLWLCWC